MTHPQDAQLERIEGRAALLARALGLVPTRDLTGLQDLSGLYSALWLE